MKSPAPTRIATIATAAAGQRFLPCGVSVPVIPPTLPEPHTERAIYSQHEDPIRHRLADRLTVLQRRCAAAPAEDQRPLRSIGFLVLPGVYNSELVAPYDVLQHLKFPR